MNGENEEIRVYDAVTTNKNRSRAANQCAGRKLSTDGSHHQPNFIFILIRKIIGNHLFEFQFIQK